MQSLLFFISNMASSKQGMPTKPLRNVQEIVEFMLETDDELSDLSDWDFGDIMDATGVSSEEEFSSVMNENLEEPPQPDPVTAGTWTMNYVWHRLNLLNLSSQIKL